MASRDKQKGSSFPKKKAKIKTIESPSSLNYDEDQALCNTATLLSNLLCCHLLDMLQTFTHTATILHSDLLYRTNGSFIPNDGIFAFFIFCNNCIFQNDEYIRRLAKLFAWYFTLHNHFITLSADVLMNLSIAAILLHKNLEKVLLLYFFLTRNSYLNQNQAHPAERGRADDSDP